MMLSGDIEQNYREFIQDLDEGLEQTTFRNYFGVSRESVLNSDQKKNEKYLLEKSLNESEMLIADMCRIYGSPNLEVKGGMRRQLSLCRALRPRQAASIWEQTAEMQSHQRTLLPRTYYFKVV